MSRVYIIFLCIIVAEAVHSVQQNRTASAIVDLYNKTLNFFENFLPSRKILFDVPLWAENIPIETIQILYNAMTVYRSLYRHIFDLCSRANKTNNKLEHQRVYLSLHIQDEFTSDMHHELEEMKGYFDSIVMNDIKQKNVENYQAITTFTDGVLKYEVIKGHTPDNIEDIVQPLLQRSKSEGNVTLMTFNGKVNHAKTILTEALSVINSTTNSIFNKEDIEDMVMKCRPFLNHKKTGNRSEFPPPPPTINPSKKDMLMKFSPNSWGWFVPEECVAILSKQTMAQLLDFYKYDQSVAEFFNAINHLSSSTGCKDHMKSFIENKYVDWSTVAKGMSDEQFMKISICLKSNTSIATGRVTIAN